MSGSDRDQRNKTLSVVGWLSAAVFVGALYFWMFYDMGASAGRYRAEREQGSQTYSASASSEAHAECVASDAPATCKREIERADREGVRNELDVESQRGMARWAFWLLVISALQFPATLAALVFVKRTLDATLDAVDDTAKATRMMERQNELMAETQRPWLKLVVGDYLNYTPRNEDGHQFAANQIDVQNFGTTPAVSVRKHTTFIKAITGLYVNEERERFARYLSHRSGGGIAVYPNETEPLESGSGSYSFEFREAIIPDHAKNADKSVTSYWLGVGVVYENPITTARYYVLRFFTIGTDMPTERGSILLRPGSGEYHGRLTEYSHD